MSADPIVKKFKEAVNMTASALEKHLEGDRSKAVGSKAREGTESVGHKEGRRIVDLLHRKQADLTEADLEHMRKVVGYVHRHLAQRPEGDVTDTDWRISLMNWGHDPLRD